MLTLPQIKQDKRAAADRLNENGAKALIIVRLASKSDKYREIRPGNERYAATVTGWETVGWYDYFSLGLMSLSSTYAQMKEYVFLETSVYDLKTEKRVWSVVTRTVVTENMDRIAELDPLVAKIVEGKPNRDEVLAFAETLKQEKRAAALEGDQQIVRGR